MNYYENDIVGCYGEKSIIEYVRILVSVSDELLLIIDKLGKQRFIQKNCVFDITDEEKMIYNLEN